MLDCMLLGFGCTNVPFFCLAVAGAPLDVGRAGVAGWFGSALPPCFARYLLDINMSKWAILSM